VELKAKTAEDIAKMTPEERMLFLQEARTQVASGKELADDVYNTVMALLRFERKVTAESSPVGRKKAANNAVSKQQTLTIDDL
jgi:hypothetical protein